MLLKWSCLVVVLLAVVTSSEVLDLHGNEGNRHGDHSPDVRDETLTPPTAPEAEEDMKPATLSNEAICRELCKKGQGGNACLCDWPPFKRRFGIKLLKYTRRFPWTRFPTVDDEPACRLLCPNGEDDHLCNCFTSLQ